MKLISGRAPRRLLIRMTREGLWGEGGAGCIYRERTARLRPSMVSTGKLQGKRARPSPRHLSTHSLLTYTLALCLLDPHHTAYPTSQDETNPPTPFFFFFLHGRGRIPGGGEHPSPPRQGSARGRFLWSVDNSSLLNNLNSNTHHRSATYRVQRSKGNGTAINHAFITVRGLLPLSSSAAATASTAATSSAPAAAASAPAAASSSASTCRTAPTPTIPRSTCASSYPAAT